MCGCYEQLEFLVKHGFLLLALEYARGREPFVKESVYV